MPSTIEELAQYFGKLDDLVAENEQLKKDLHRSEAKVSEYRKAVKDMRGNMYNHIANYKGAIRRQEDEIHVLYHKISTLMNRKKPKTWDKMNTAQRRVTLQEMLDKVEPTNINFLTGIRQKPYTLAEFATKPYEDPVGNDMPDPPLSFC